MHGLHSHHPKNAFLALVSPDLGQQILVGEFVPAGEEAADSLRKLIGDQPITCFIGGRAMPYVGDVSIRHAMLINGWALADHSSEHPDEIIARENKRGLWRGEFVNPIEWQNGTRLPGESA